MSEQKPQQKTRKSQTGGSAAKQAVAEGASRRKRLAVITVISVVVGMVSPIVSVLVYKLQTEQHDFKIRQAMQDSVRQVETALYEEQRDKLQIRIQLEQLKVEMERTKHEAESLRITKKQLELQKRDLEVQLEQLSVQQLTKRVVDQTRDSVSMQLDISASQQEALQEQNRLLAKQARQQQIEMAIDQINNTAQTILAQLQAKINALLQEKVSLQQTPITMDARIWAFHKIQADQRIKKIDQESEELMARTNLIIRVQNEEVQKLRALMQE